jgi:hypothetical protein
MHYNTAHKNRSNGSISNKDGLTEPVCLISNNSHFGIGFSLPNV